MYQLPKLGAVAGLVHGISEVSEGNMSFHFGGEGAVSGNRERLFRALSVDSKRCIIMKEGQRDTEIYVAGADLCSKGVFDGNGVKTDALITREKGIFLAVLVADCLPVIVYDPDRRVLALVHVGWRSADAKLLKKVVGELTARHGGKPARLIVGIGPGIHKESYVFKNPVQKQSADWAPFLTDVPDRQTAVDLGGYSKGQLLDAGVLSELIEVSDVDTAQSFRFFSHYRAVRRGEIEGRFCTVVGMV